MRPVRRTRRLLGLAVCLAGIAVSWSFLPAVRWSSRETRLTDIRPEQGLAFLATAGDEYPSDREAVSELQLFEDDVPLEGHQPHARIRSEGGGRFSHWGTAVYFSSTDGSDPRTNGRSYRLVCPPLASVPTDQGWLGVLITALGLAIMPWSGPRVAAARDGARRMARRQGAVLIAVLMIGTAVFVQGASTNARLVNTDVSRGDQSAYLQYARDMSRSDYAYVGGRNRMPLVPFIQSLAYSPDLTEQQFFERAKSLHIAWSVGLLGVLCAALVATTGWSMALFLTATVGFGVFVFKAGYTQADLTFYVLFFLAFLLLARLVWRSSLALCLLAGVVLGLTQLTKAAALPLLALYVMLALGVAWRRRSVRRALIGRVLGGVCVVGAFLATVWPYISTSKRVFGRYFYNVNSTFYMWYDSWDEVVAGTRAHGDRSGWPTLPADQLPGPWRYLRAHGVGGCLQRVAEGFADVGHAIVHSFGFQHVVAALLLGTAVLVLARAGRVLRMTRRRLATTLFALLTLAAYAILYAWYARITPDVRFSLALLLPLVFCLARLLRLTGIQKRAVRVGRFAISGQALLLASLWGVLVAQLIPILATRLPSMYGGS